MPDRTHSGPVGAEEQFSLPDRCDDTATAAGRLLFNIIALAAQQCVNATRAVSEKIGDARAYVGNQFGIGQRWSSPRS